MSNDNTQLFRVEIQHPAGRIDCHQCLHPDQLGEVLAPIVTMGEAAKGTVIEVFDYQVWRHDLVNNPLCKLLAL